MELTNAGIQALKDYQIAERERIFHKQWDEKFNNLEARLDSLSGKVQKLSREIKLITEKKERDILEVPGCINKESWSEFEEHRKLIKKPLTNLARKKLFNSLKDFTFDEQSEAINESIKSRWAGIFPKKINGAQNERFARSNTARSESNLARVSRKTKADIAAER